jgi:hypothetical protein
MEDLTQILGILSRATLTASDIQELIGSLLVVV